jgi:hypothetical protein
MGKQAKMLISLTLYDLIIGGLTIYHGFNFSDYVHWKGDETTYYILFLLFTSFLFYIFSGIFDLKAATLAIIINFVLSFFMGLGLLLISGLSGITRHLIFIYGGCYMTFLTILTFIQSRRLMKD